MGGTEQSNSIALRTCEEYSELVGSWKKAMKWSEGLDSALIVMLASSMSTQFVGEQLWIKVLGPPSSGKTTLMEGLATATEWYLSKDTIRGFHSGWKQEDDKDVSLAHMAKGKTLGIKDGDTLLKAPNLKQILAEGRALYDKVSRTNYRNDVNREYVGHRMTWHLAGTASLREIDDSELGARFLDVVVMDKIEEEFENEVGKRAARQEARNMLHLSNGKPEAQHPEELANSMALSGGYLDFLRTNALEIAKEIQVSDECYDRCEAFGKFTAFMRARQSSEEGDGREFSPRLIKQYTRLAISVAAVLNKSKVDGEAMHHVHRVTMHTSRGPTLDLVGVLDNLPQGMEVRGLATLMYTSDEKLRTQLKFLRKIGVVETDVNRKRWRVTPKISKMYKEVKSVAFS
jgi:adenylate kinase family enzyme